MAESRERDLVLAPNEYAFILDETKGHVVAYVGPHKTSMANTDRPVVYDAATRRYKRCLLEEAIIPFPFAEEGWYIVLENPVKGGDEAHPASGPNSLPKLTFGRKINLPGPCTFPLWPGQVARVIEGHQLRSNQYLIVQVYNEEAARENWAKAVIKPQKPGGAEGPSSDGTAGDGASPAGAVLPTQEIPDLTTGKLLVVKGTDVSFYIPPTGIEVAADSRGQYVRDAVTLERLEYCILLDEDGNKRYIRGPAVVFPRPTEMFVERGGTRKFRAIELNEISGLYIKVIAPYSDEQGDHRVGEELFITGRDQMIYFPRPEHAIIKYGDQEIHYGVAIPAGEARYVLRRLTGEIFLKRGPCTFLADPRQEVIVRRVLDPRTVELLFPGNQEALDYNRALAEHCRRIRVEHLAEREGGGSKALAKAQEPKRGVAPQKEEASFAGDDFTRLSQFTQPRAITLDTKYDGAVTIEVWTGYACLVVGKSGQRKVIVGPCTYLLEYDEILEAMLLSTGTPKTDSKLIRTAYLRVLNNKVSDLVTAETNDLCQVQIALSYRVNFELPSERWFNVENYVKFLCDHLRSLLRNAVKQLGIEQFYARSIEIVRSTILGVAVEVGNRPGRLFEENGMRVYDVEVLDVKIGDQAIEGVLVEAQHLAVKQAIQIAQEERSLQLTNRSAQIKRAIEQTHFETTSRSLELKTLEAKKQLELNLVEIATRAEAEERKLEATLAQQDVQGKITTAELWRERARYELRLEQARGQLAMRLEELRADVDAVARKAEAVAPELIAALQAFADKELAGRMAQTMAPLAILGGKSVADVLGQLLKGTALEAALLPKQIDRPKE